MGPWAGRRPCPAPTSLGHARPDSSPEGYASHRCWRHPCSCLRARAAGERPPPAGLGGPPAGCGHRDHGARPRAGLFHRRAVRGDRPHPDYHSALPHPLDHPLLRACLRVPGGDVGISLPGAWQEQERGVSVPAHQGTLAGGAGAHRGTSGVGVQRRLRERCAVRPGDLGDRCLDDRARRADPSPAWPHRRHWHRDDRGPQPPGRREPGVAGALGATLDPAPRTGGHPAPGRPGAVRHLPAGSVDRRHGSRLRVRRAHAATDGGAPDACCSGSAAGSRSRF